MGVVRFGYTLLKRAAQNQGSSDPFDGASDSYGFDDDSDDYDDDGYGSWWWSPTGMAVRYSIIIVLFALAVVFFLGGYWHAQRRMRKGLPLLRYHAWMVRRRQPQPYYPQQQAPFQRDGYTMNEYQQPPPAYNPHSQAPPAYQPTYQPPEGGSKVLADQQSHVQVHRVEDEGEGSSVAAPPAAVRQ